jgi:hypothetical protein
MNVLIIQENGRHDANRNFRECFSLQRAFKKLNHDCEVWGLGHDNFLENVDWELYDIILNIENYDESGWVPSLVNTTKPIKLLWSIDAHCRGEEVFENTFTEGNYNYLLHSTKDYVKKDHHVWFPNGFDDTLIYPMDVEKKYDLGFCGNYVNRKEILEYLEREYGLHLDIFVIGDDMVKAINSYGCHFNLNIANDINYRSFETIGCGTLLLTNYNDQYEELGFIDGENCFMYKSTEELHDKIKQIKEIDTSSIAKNGWELSKQHTYTKRIMNLIKETCDVL